MFLPALLWVLWRALKSREALWFAVAGILMALMMLAGINVLYFTIFEEPWAVGPEDDAPFTAKAVAASALILVVGVLYCGRMLPFIGNAF